eukprot:GHVN01078278.1.p1 GENE.GHVN01078278.1~~GHVN01078278.1.p1  ORF type:complete len:508 (+),score=67.52 GHVN01078278.1:217-1524(+)
MEFCLKRGAGIKEVLRKNIASSLLCDNSGIAHEGCIQKFISVLSECLLKYRMEYEFDSLDEKMGFLKEMQEKYGVSALSLSGGGIIGKIHLGVVKCLASEKALPEIIAGASVGSVIAAALCTSDETVDIDTMACPSILERNSEDLTLAERIKRKLMRLFQNGVLFDSEASSKELKLFFGEITFKESFEKTGKQLNISVTAVLPTQKAFVLNHKTAPIVYIWSAVMASISIPGLFHPHKILEKKEDGKCGVWMGDDHLFIDGSIKNDIPSEFLKEHLNVKHNIVSQLNPHINPFLKYSGRFKRFSFLYLKIVDYIKRSSFIQNSPRLSLLKAVLLQKYNGETTITPEIPLEYLLQPLSSVKQDKMSDHILRGEKATWPYLKKIKERSQLENELKKHVLDLEKEIAKNKEMKGKYCFTLDEKILSTWKADLDQKVQL